MKKSRLFPLFIVLAVFLLFGCASSISTLKKVGKALKPWGDYTPVPPPQAGLVLPVNENPAVWVESFLCKRRFSRSEAFVSGSGKGWLSFAEMPIAHFTINPSKGTPYNHGVPVIAATVPLLLDYPAVDYTLIFFYQNFNQHLRTVAARNKGRWEIPFIELEVIPFSTTGDPLRENYQEIYYADRVIRLARVEPYERRQLTFHRIFYPGEVVMRHLGFR